jgi:RimJ/RimL family protein N-acetyltransferase
MAAELQTERLRLGPWHDDDLEAYAALVGERDRQPDAALRGARPSLDELPETIRRQQSALADTGITLLVIRRDAAFAGYCGLTQGRATLAEPELAYELLRRYHGKGYATEAARAVVDAAAATGRRRLWATVRPWNQASLRVLDKIGFAPTSRVTHDDLDDVLWRDRPL